MRNIMLNVNSVELLDDINMGLSCNTLINYSVEPLNDCKTASSCNALINKKLNKIN